MIQHNLEYQRNKCLQEASANGSNGEGTRSVSFQYAVQCDGSTLGEELWKQRQQSGVAYKFVDDQSNPQLLSQVSLSNIESKILQLMAEYQNQEALPPSLPTSSHTLLQPNSTESSSSHEAFSSFHQPPSKENQYPNCSLMSRYNASSKSSNNKIPSEQQPKQDNRVADTSISPNSKNNDDDDDMYDDSILANFDVDRVISQHRQTRGGDMNCKTLDEAASHTFSYTSHNSSFRVSQQPKQFCNEVETRQSPLNTQSNWNLTMITGSSNTTYTAHEHSALTNSHSVGYNNETSSASYQHHQELESSGDVPLCSGHQLPARLLTSNSTSNPGRKFYKCSLPQNENCDFFAWHDGLEGNWNNARATGQIRDMHEGNSRVFGHRSFRPGQQEVIEKAIQGRDVFVLMPTGYVTSDTSVAACSVCHSRFFCL